MEINFAGFDNSQGLPRSPREGWEAAATECSASGEDADDAWNALLDDFHEEWEWT